MSGAGSGEGSGRGRGEPGSTPPPLLSPTTTTTTRNEKQRVSLDEFSKAMKMRNLQNYFPRTQQRTLFEYLDYNKDEHVLISDLKSYLASSETFQGNHHHPGTGGGAGGGESLSTDTEALSKVKIQKVKDDIIERIFSRRRAAKLQDGQEYVRGGGGGGGGNRAVASSLSPRCNHHAMSSSSPAAAPPNPPPPTAHQVRHSAPDGDLSSHRQQHVRIPHEGRDDRGSRTQPHES